MIQSSSGLPLSSHKNFIAYVRRRDRDAHQRRDKQSADQGERYNQEVLNEGTGSPCREDFAGCLQAYKSDPNIFVTTSTFGAAARSDLSHTLGR
jgi:restriction endonuclease Mrr